MYIYMYMYMYIHTHIVCFEGEKKAQIIFAPGGRGNPGPLPSIRSRDDIIHLQTPYTFRHNTPGLAGGRRRRHGHPSIATPTNIRRHRHRQHAQARVPNCPSPGVGVHHEQPYPSGWSPSRRGRPIVARARRSKGDTERVGGAVYSSSCSLRASAGSIGRQTSARWHGFVQIALQFALCIETQNPTSGMRLRYRTNRGQ